MRTAASRLIGLAAVVAGVLAWDGGVAFGCGMCVLAVACLALRPAWPTTCVLALACLCAALPMSVSTSRGGAADRLTLAFLLLMTAAAIDMIRAHRAEVVAPDGIGDSAT